MIISCIDSRVPPELVFDTGLGDLFVICTGGQVVPPVVVGSVEYAHLGDPARGSTGAWCGAATT
ncbi:carbonic anhydrase [Streptomyces coeruleorubidus]|uniref:carbonic anhydrase n=1 Tax=Streptomyces coeruleorubidus TaxID=116188 RepID=UPI0033F2B49C